MPDLTSPRPFVFVLMPFSADFDDTYQLAIKPACEKAGAYAERVDEQIFEGNILDRIFNQIAKADIIIADLSGRNPNVFYETGYAHALGKRTLLLTRTAEDIPFDLNQLPHIIYGGRLTDLILELEKRLRWYIANPNKRELTPANLIVHLNDVPIVGIPCIHISEFFGTDDDRFELLFELHNDATRELRAISCRVGLITPSEFTDVYHFEDPFQEVRLKNGTSIHLPDYTLSLPPEMWERASFFVPANWNLITRRTPYDFALRLFAESGPLDYPFTLVFDD